jgi:hypothetical protein
MSAVPTHVRLSSEPARAVANGKKLSLKARVYLAAVGAAAVAFALPFVIRLTPETEGWLTFIILATAAAVAIGLILATAVADWVENASYVRLVDFGWQEQPSFESDEFHRRVLILWVAAALKWLFALVAVLLSTGVLWVLLVEWLRTRGGWDWKRIRATAHPAAFHAVLALTFGFALLAHEQLADLIRRWTVLQLVVSTTLAAGLALVGCASNPTPVLREDLARVRTDLARIEQSLQRGQAEVLPDERPPIADVDRELGHAVLVLGDADAPLGHHRR